VHAERELQKKISNCQKDLTLAVTSNNGGIFSLLLERQLTGRLVF